MRHAMDLLQGIRKSFQQERLDIFEWNNLHATAIRTKMQENRERHKNSN